MKPEALRQRKASVSTRSNLQDLFSREFSVVIALAKCRQAQTTRVLLVFFSGNPFQVFNTIIGFDAVDVIDKRFIEHFRRTEGIHNQSMNHDIAANIANAQHYVQITTQMFFGLLNAFKAFVMSSYLAVVGDVVDSCQLSESDGRPLALRHWRNFITSGWSRRRLHQQLR